MSRAYASADLLFMPITLYANPDLAFHVVRLEGAMLFDEFKVWTRLHDRRPDWAAIDAIHVFDDQADVNDITDARLDVMRNFYQRLHPGLNLQHLRRSAWVTRGRGPLHIIRYFLQGRHRGDQHRTDVRVYEGWDKGDDLFTPDEWAAARTLDGFAPLHRIRGGEDSVVH